MRRSFLILLVSGLLVSCTGFSEPASWSQVQDDSCVFFIQDPSGARELWYWCEGQAPGLFMEGMRDIQDYTAAGDGNAIYYIQMNKTGSADLWISENLKANPQLLLSCSGPLCASLAYSMTSRILAFSDFEDEPRLKLFDLDRRQINEYAFNATDLEFSPDGKFLSFFDRKTNQLVVLNITNEEIITVDSQEGLTGGWSDDSQQILYGAMTFRDETPGVIVYSLNLLNGQSEILGGETANLLEYYQPKFFRSSDHFIAAIRDPNFGFNKQLWVFNREGDLVTQITLDYASDHSAFQVNSKLSRILFQRFSPGTQNSQPEVWMVDLEGNELMLVTRNATNPQWVFSN
jgi:dipeptidyl aminopeptidase/acylaminoacyl peptidase